MAFSSSILCCIEIEVLVIDLDVANDEDFHVFEFWFQYLVLYSSHLFLQNFRGVMVYLEDVLGSHCILLVCQNR